MAAGGSRARRSGRWMLRAGSSARSRYAAARRRDDHAIQVEVWEPKTGRSQAPYVLASLYLMSRPRVPRAPARGASVAEAERGQGGEIGWGWPGNGPPNKSLEPTRPAGA
jgi:hypothetical protein